MPGAEIPFQIVEESRILAQLNDPRIFWIHAAKERAVGAQGVRQHQRVPAIIFRAGHGVTVPKPIQLLGVNRKHGKPAGEDRFHEQTSWGFDRHRHVAGLGPGLRQHAVSEARDHDGDIATAQVALRAPV